MNSVAIVTLTRFPDIFTPFAESVDRHEAAEHARIVVTSGGASIKRPGWQELPGIEPFVWARNANLGINAAPDSDILLSNDDVALNSPVIETLQRIAYANPQIGVLSPQIIGDGINNVQAMARYPITRDWIVSGSPLLPFVCVYLPRKALNAVGKLDESFTGYGGDDQDWCLRAKKAGFQLAITPLVKVFHGFEGRKYSSSFARVMNERERSESLAWSVNRVRELHHA